MLILDKIKLSENLYYTFKIEINDYKSPHFK
jgi:hypothetical protein